MSADQEICYDFSIERLRNKRVSDVTYAGQACLGDKGVRVRARTARGSKATIFRPGRDAGWANC